MEREFKWDASAHGAFARFRRALKEVCKCTDAASVLVITDRYLDNATADFSRRKIALRIRRCAGRFEATLKTRSALQSGLALRRELTRLLPQARSFPSALRALENEGTWEGLPLRGLYPRFVIRNRRQIIPVRSGACVCEAALDSYVITAGGRRQRRREIELELKSGPEKDFALAVKKLSSLCGLGPVLVSKVAGAEKLLSAKN